MKSKKTKTIKKKEEHLIPAFETLLNKLDGGGWQIVKFEMEDDK